MSTLKQHATEQVDARAARGGSKSIYRIQRHDAAQYVRDRNCWCADIDLSCVSPWNSTGQVKRGGCLVTPQHVLFAQHYRLTTSTVIRFVGMHRKQEGRYAIVEDRRVQKVWNDGKSDLAIAMLDAPLPDYIKPAKCLPPNFLEYLPIPHGGLPLIATDQEEKVIVQEVTPQKPDGLDDYNRTCQLTWYGDVTRPEFFELWVSGDSGDPLMMVVDDLPVIIGVAWGAYSVPTVHGHYDLINQQLQWMGGRYQLQPIDLSGFEHFTESKAQ